MRNFLVALNFLYTTLLFKKKWNGSQFLLKWGSIQKRASHHYNEAQGDTSTGRNVSKISQGSEPS